MSRPLPHFSPGHVLSARALQTFSNRLRERDRYKHVGSPVRGGHGRRRVADARMPFDCALAGKQTDEAGGKIDYYLTVRAGTVELETGLYAEIPEKTLKSELPVKVEHAGFAVLTVTRRNDGKLVYKYEILEKRPGEAVEIMEEGA